MSLVIFDCDGVLVDSEPISVRHDVELFAELGLPMSEAEVIDRFVGRSADVIVAAIEKQLGHLSRKGCSNGPRSACETRGAPS